MPISGGLVPASPRCCIGHVPSHLQMTNTIQKSYKVSSTQLLYQSAPYQAAILILTGPFVDAFLTGMNVFSFAYTQTVIVSQLGTWSFI